MATYVDIDSIPTSTLRYLASLRVDRDRDRYFDYLAMAE